VSDRKPLVIADGQIEQLQSPEDLDIPLNDRVALLESQMKSVATFLAGEGFELPDELTELL
jgi:hypothetical protein